MKLKDLIMCSLMTCIIIVSAYISIPLVVPFTLQTFSIFLSLLILGYKRSIISIMLYIILGMIGLPVFSGFRSGVGVIIGPTGGYIIGFILMAVVYIFFENRKDIFKCLGLLIGLILCYILGSIWFLVVYANDIRLSKVLMISVIPFIIPDLIKMAIAIIVYKRIILIKEKGTNLN